MFHFTSSNLKMKKVSSVSIIIKANVSIQLRIGYMYVERQTDRFIFTIIYMYFLVAVKHEIRVWRTNLGKILIINQINWLLLTFLKWYNDVVVIIVLQHRGPHYPPHVAIYWMKALLLVNYRFQRRGLWLSSASVRLSVCSTSVFHTFFRYAFEKWILLNSFTLSNSKSIFTIVSSVRHSFDFFLDSMFFNDWIC